MTASPPLPSTSTSRQETLAPGRSHTVAAPPICSPITTLLPDAPRASAAAAGSSGDGKARKKPSRDARKEAELSLELVVVL